MKMKKTIMSIVVTLLVMAGLVSGSTEIWSNVRNYGGLTEYREYTSVAGFDPSEGLGEIETTGFVDFSMTNDNGYISLQTYVYHPGPWKMVKLEEARGSGDTGIFKHMDVWTEWDVVDCGGMLEGPTEAWAETTFMTPILTDVEGVHFLMDIPPAQDKYDMEDGNHGIFDKVIYTTDDYNFYGKEGINLFPSDFYIPEPYSPPEPHPFDDK